MPGGSQLSEITGAALSGVIATAGLSSFLAVTVIAAGRGLADNQCLFSLMDLQVCRNRSFSPTPTVFLRGPTASCLRRWHPSFR
ncbi:hypothetical protein EMIT0P291_20009 [Pseudomonas sp. IT-P291]